MPWAQGGGHAGGMAYYGLLGGSRALTVFWRRTDAIRLDTGHARERERDFEQSSAVFARASGKRGLAIDMRGRGAAGSGGRRLGFGHGETGMPVRSLCESRGSDNRAPQTVVFAGQKRTFSTFWRPGVLDQGVASSEAPPLGPQTTLVLPLHVLVCPQGPVCPHFLLLQDTRWGQSLL